MVVDGAKHIPFFVPASRGYYYGQRGKNIVTITIPSSNTGFTVTLSEPATPYIPESTPYIPPSTPYIPPPTPYVPPSTPYIPGQW